MRFFFNDKDEFNWHSVSAMTMALTALGALASWAFLGPVDDGPDAEGTNKPIVTQAPVDDPQRTGQTASTGTPASDADGATPAADDADAYTRWARRVVRFEEAPGEVGLCSTARTAFIEVDAVNQLFLVDGEPLQQGETREISDTCRITGFSLTDARNWQSGGTLNLMYRERR